MRDPLSENPIIGITLGGHSISIRDYGVSRFPRCKL